MHLLRPQQIFHTGFLHPIPIPGDRFTEMALDFVANPLPVSLFKPAVLISQKLSIPHHLHNLSYPSSQPIHHSYHDAPRTLCEGFCLVWPTIEPESASPNIRKRAGQSSRQLTDLSASSSPPPFKLARQASPETEAFDEEIERIFEEYKAN